MTWFWVTVGKKCFDVTPAIVYHLTETYGPTQKNWHYYSPSSKSGRRIGGNRARWKHDGRKIGFRSILDAETFRADLTFLLLKEQNEQGEPSYF